MRLYLLIALGGAAGTVLRYFLTDSAARLWGDSFPWATLAINVTGSLMIGFVYTATAPEGRWPAGAELRHFVMVGFCGGYTTFSAFSLQTLNLVRQGDWLKAGGNVAGSVVLCLAGVWFGHLAALALSSERA